MSLLSDIIQLFGTGSVPAIVAGSVLAVFELGERFASQRAKDALSKWLFTFDVQKAKALPDGTRELFERIFGERHFSLKCFVRSAMFSVGAMAFIGLLLFLTYPKGLLEALDYLLMHNLDEEDQVYGYILRYGLAVQLMLWTPWSIMIDYVSLFKTRYILGVLARIRRRNSIVACAIVVIDYVVYRLIYSTGMALLGIGTLLAWNLHNLHGILLIPNFWREIITEPEGLISSLYSIFFWSGFAPSIWMWLYVLALFVTRALLRSEKLVNWLRWFLDVEKAPFRSIGAVAATLGFIASVAIILVSAEVSRISTAS